MCPSPVWEDFGRLMINMELAACLTQEQRSWIVFIIIIGNIL